MNLTNKFFCFGLFFVISLQLPAQVVFQQRLDSVNMLIGDQQNLTLNSNSPDFGENPFIILDTLHWMQLLDKGKWIMQQGQYERKILFTVFDSGYYIIPRLGLVKQGDSLIAAGNPLSLEVNNPQDSLQILRPIKFIEETKIIFPYLKWMLFGLLFILGMLFVLWLFFKADRVRPSVIYPPSEKKIWEQCLEQLYTLEDKKLWQNNFVKEYYDELNFILRKFLSEGLKVPALENTSNEIIEYLHNFKPEMKDIEILRDCFQTSDLTKFANLIPGAVQNEDWMKFARQFIKNHKELSETTLEQMRTHWQALIGKTLADQFENPFETVPEEFIRLYDGKEVAEIEFMHSLIYRIRFTLPLPWKKWHDMHTGLFYRWHHNILDISTNSFIQFLTLILVLPFVTLFLPFIYIISLWKKQNLFSRGVFGLSSKNKLVLRK